MRVRQAGLSIGLVTALACLALPVERASAAEGQGAHQAALATSEPIPSGTAGPQDMPSARSAGPAESKPAHAPGVTLVDEDGLRERVQARWNAVINGEFTKAYAFETPEFRNAIEPADYAFRLGRASVRWHLASLKELRYDRADQADAVMTIEYSFAISGGDGLATTSGDFPERWVFLDGNWWRKETKAPVGSKPQPKPSLEQ
jgi:hypothetical protein